MSNPSKFGESVEMRRIARPGYRERNRNRHVTLGVLLEEQQTFGAAAALRFEGSLFPFLSSPRPVLVLRRNRRLERVPHCPADRRLLFPNVRAYPTHSVGPETVAAVDPSPTCSLGFHRGAVALHQAAPRDDSLRRTGFGGGCSQTSGAPA